MDTKPLIDNLWRFIRGDMATADFEQWVYETDDLKTWLGNELYLWCLSVKYHDKWKVWEFRQELQIVLDDLVPRKCLCPTWTDDQKIPLGLGNTWIDLTKRYQIIKRRTPWLSLLQCKVCGAYWYVAMDTDGDDYFLHRLGLEGVKDILKHDRWPDLFDRMPIFWPDTAWLESNGYKSLKDWQKKNIPPA